MVQLLFPLLFLGAMWLLLVRPQQERVRRHRQLIATLAVGDEVVTAGGILGRIVQLDDDRVHVEVAPGVVLRLLRPAINARPADDAAGAGPGSSGPGELLPGDEEAGAP